MSEKVHNTRSKQTAPGRHGAAPDDDLIINECSDAIEADPDDPRAFCRRGLAYARKHQFGKAISDFDRAISLGFNDATTHYLRGRAWHLKGNLARAIADYNRTVELDPGHTKARQALESVEANLKHRRQAPAAARNAKPKPDLHGLRPRWARRFALLDRMYAGKTLTRREQRAVNWSFLGAVFGVWYYFYLGLYRKAFVILGVMVAAGAAFDLIGVALPSAQPWISQHDFLISQALSTAAGGTLVVRDYYAFKVRGETMWPKLGFLDGPYRALAFAIAIFVVATGTVYAFIGPSDARGQIAADQSSRKASEAGTESSAQSTPRPVRKTWRTSIVTDKMTDASYLKATATARTPDTLYEISITCGSKDALSISTFKPDGTGKAMNWRYDSWAGANLNPFLLRIDDRKPEERFLVQGDYSNSGTTNDLLDQIKGAFAGTSGPVVSRIISSRRIVIGEVFEGEQFELENDLPDSFRACEAKLADQAALARIAASGRAVIEKLDKTMTEARNYFVFTELERYISLKGKYSPKGISFHAIQDSDDNRQSNDYDNRLAVVARNPAVIGGTYDIFIRGISKDVCLWLLDQSYDRKSINKITGYDSSRADPPAVTNVWVNEKFVLRQSADKILRAESADKACNPKGNIIAWEVEDHACLKSNGQRACY